MTCFELDVNLIGLVVIKTYDITIDIDLHLFACDGLGYNILDPRLY